MTDKLPPETPVHVAAHNALAATVEMYGALLREGERREKALLLNIQMLRQQLAEVTKVALASTPVPAVRAVPEPVEDKMFGHPGDDTRTRMTRTLEPA